MDCYSADLVLREYNRLRETMQNKDISTDLEAWLTLFTSHDLTKIEYLLTHFEGFDEIYRELFQMRQKPEELIYMYQNIFLETDLYEESPVLDDMREEIKEKRIEIQEQDQKIQAQQQEIQDQKKEIQRMLDFMAEHGLEYK